MREILFRGKSKWTGNWLYGNYCKYVIENGEPEKHYIMANGTGGLPGWFDSYEVEPETIGQYTGLVDGKGKKIFESDIIFSEGYRGIVKFGAFGYPDFPARKTRLGFYIDWETLNAFPPDYRKDIMFWTEERDTEVVGNIYGK